MPADANRDHAPRPIWQMGLGCIAIPLLTIAMLAFFYLRFQQDRSNLMLVPEDSLVLLHEEPDEGSPLLARYGPGRQIRVLSRDPSWLWLEVERWDGRQAWARRPLDILPWRLKAELKDLPTSTMGEALETEAPAESKADSGVTTEAQRPPAPDVLVPAGTFAMGSPEGEGNPDEQPVHQVELSAFRIDQNEVSIGAYWHCVLNGPCKPPAKDGIGEAAPHLLADPTHDHRAMVNVSWHEAKTYCNWLNKRLPTEAEWERSALWAEDEQEKRIWPWGDADPRVSGVRLAMEEAPLLPGESGSFDQDRSPEGVMDLAGNAREWVHDWYKADYFSKSEGLDPRGPSPRRGAGAGKVIRGASYLDAIENARTAKRGHANPQYGYADVGFRCASDS